MLYEIFQNLLKTNDLNKNQNVSSIVKYGFIILVFQIIKRNCLLFNMRLFILPWNSYHAKYV